MSSDFDPYYKWLGIAPEEQPPHHYRLLAIRPFEDDADVIEAAADRLMAQLRTYQTGKHSAFSQKLLNEVAAAKICLLRPEKKAAYDAQLRELLGRQSAGEDTSSQLQAIRALDQAIAAEIARPVSQRKRQTAEGPPWLALGVVVAVLLALVVAWALFGRGKTEVAAKKAEGSSRPSAVSSQAEAGAGQKPTPKDLSPKTQDPANKAESGERKAAPPPKPPAVEEMPKTEPNPIVAPVAPPAVEKKAESGKPEAEEKPKPAATSPVPAASSQSLIPNPLPLPPPNARFPQPPIKRNPRKKPKTSSATTTRRRRSHRNGRNWPEPF